SEYFFSSRRRHTRSKRDWSSDVCSSDLILIRISAEIAGVRLFSVNDEHRAADFIRILQDRLIQERHTSGHVPAAVGIKRARMVRSEERRVGEVCVGGDAWKL